MTGGQRREQLLEVGRRLFAERGFDGTSVEEVALRAGVSKPVVYEHFGGKEGVYAVVVDREISALTTALTEALAGRTALVIAHRLSTIRGADLILVVEQGRIVERGRHDELIEANGRYAELYRTQFAVSG